MLKDSAAGREEFSQQKERRRLEEGSADYRLLRRGWCLGSEEFREALLAGEADAVGANQYGTERFETGQEQAGRLMAQELKHRGWNEKELQRRRKGNKEKVKMARRLRAETPMTLGWIARRLSMGTAGSLANTLRERSHT